MSLSKAQWKELYQKLDSIHSEFSNAYWNYKNGKNQKLRTSASRDVDSTLRKADFYIRQHGEAFDLLTGQSGTDEQSRTFVYDEFIQAHHFGRDMPDFLERIKEKINSFNEQQ